MYVDVHKYIINDDHEEIPYGDVYVTDRTEALAVSSTDYIIGTKMYIVETGGYYVACHSGWYDVDGTKLT